MPRRTRRKRPEPQVQMPAAAKVVIGVVSVAVGVLVLLVALWLTGFAMTAATVAFRARDVAFFVGALLLMALAVVSVTIAGPNLLKGLPFHLIGTIGSYSLGTAFVPFERLRVAGTMIYAAAWCWTYLGETVVRLIRGRVARPK